MCTPLVKPVRGDWRSTRAPALARLAGPSARRGLGLGRGRLGSTDLFGAVGCVEMWNVLLLNAINVIILRYKTLAVTGEWHQQLKMHLSP